MSNLEDKEVKGNGNYKVVVLNFEDKVKDDVDLQNEIFKMNNYPVNVKDNMVNCTTIVDNIVHKEVRNLIKDKVFHINI